MATQLTQVTFPNGDYIIGGTGDTKVTQTATSTDANYEILFSGTADNMTRTEGARKDSGLIFNPNKDALTVGSRASGSTVGTCSIALGSNVTASGGTSHAEGHTTIASGIHSHAEGYSTTASGFAAHAEGNSTTASGEDSHAEGFHTIANHQFQRVFGEYNIEDPSTAETTEKGNYIEIVGNGTTNSARSNARTLDWDGNEWIQGNFTAEGGVLTVGSRASGSTVGTGSIALGNGVTSSGTNSCAEGDYTIASGQFSHAEGSGTIASGLASHVEGEAIEASGEASHAEGGGTTASGGTSHAEGYSTTASGYSSHAEGVNTIASGYGSHAEGSNTTANHLAQHVFGRYNIADPSTAAATNRGNYVEIVGNGTSASAKSNARTLDWDGNEILAGNLTLGGTSSDIVLSGIGNTWDGNHTSLKGALTPVVVSDSTVNLNNYTSSGKWIMTGAITTRTNFPHSGYPGYLEVVRWAESANNHYCRQDFKIYNKGIYSPVVCSRLGSSDDSGSTWNWGTWYSENYMLPDETLDFPVGYPAYGFITTSGKEMHLYFPVCKYLNFTSGVKTMPSSISCTIRQNGNYIGTDFGAATCYPKDWYRQKNIMELVVYNTNNKNTATA